MICAREETPTWRMQPEFSAYLQTCPISEH